MTKVILDINAERIMKVLTELDFGLLDRTAEDLQSPSPEVQLGFPLQGIDLLTGIDRVEFEDAWSRRFEGQANAVNVPFTGREDLSTKRRSASQIQVLADVARLEELKTKNRMLEHRERRRIRQSQRDSNPCLHLERVMS